VCIGLNMTRSRCLVAQCVSQPYKRTIEYMRYDRRV